MSKSQKAKYFLRKWPYYDKNVQYLEEIEQLKMKILYEALKELTAEQRKFLAEKYRVFGGLPVNDETMAKRHQVTLKEYRQIRIQHENIFYKYLIEAEKKYRNDPSLRDAAKSSLVLCRRINTDDLNRMVEEVVDAFKGGDLKARITEDEVRSLVRSSMEYLVKEIDLNIR